MTPEQKQIVLSALDMLGTALADHGHVWSMVERSAYENAVLLLK